MATHNNNRTQCQEFNRSDVDNAIALYVIEQSVDNMIDSLEIDSDVERCFEQITL